MAVTDKTSNDYEKFFAPEFPSMGTGPIPAEAYTSPEYFEKERENIFKKTWMMVGREQEIPEPGDYFQKPISILNANLIVVRGKDGIVRAFHNSCRHRGNQVCYEQHGNTKFFSCGFHGWVYDNMGKLVHVTDRDRFFDLDEATLALAPIATETWNGFIFVNAEPEPEQNLKDYLGGLGEQLDGYPFDKMVQIGKWSAQVKCNWKVFIDAFHELYHVGWVHRNWLGPAFVEAPREAARISSVRIYGPHHSATIPRNPNYQPTEIEQLAYKYSGGGMVRNREARGLPEGPPPGINPDGDANHAFEVNVIFPINFIDMAPDWYFTYEFWPVAVDETHWVCKMYSPKPQTIGERLAQEVLVVQFRDGLLEDLSTEESTQQGLKSGAVPFLQFSDQEITCRHLYEAADQMVRGKKASEIKY